MKEILCLIMMTTIVSCGSKNKTSDDYEILIAEVNEPSAQLDSDFDGISDIEELRRGSNPSIANYPKLNFQVSSLDFTNELNYEAIGMNKFKRLKHIIGELEYKKYFEHESNKLTLSLNEIESSQARCLSRFKSKELINLNSNKLKVYFNINPEDMSHIEEVSNIQGNIDQSIKFNILDKFKNINEYKKKNELNLDINHSSDKVASKCIEITDLNYTYKTSGINLQLSKIRNKIEKNLAHIVILTDKKHISLSVNPESFKIKSLLEYLRLNPIFSTENELLNLNGLSNDFHENKLIDLSSDNQLELGRWFFNSSNNSNINAPLEAGEFYSLSYLKVKDLLTHSPKKLETKFFSSFGHDETNKLDELKIGDRVEIRLKYLDQDNLLPSESYTASGFLFINFSLTGAYSNKQTARACKIKKSNLFDSNLYKKLLAYIPSIEDFKLKLPARDIIPLKKENELIYDFQIQKDDLKSDSLAINLKNILPESFEYERHLSESDLSKNKRCKSGDVLTNSHTVLKLKAARELKYEGSISVFSPIL
jgi:hypothetical protein